MNVERFQAFRSGEITYAQWVDLDVGEWQCRDVTREQIVDSLGELRLVDGARETVGVLRERGYSMEASTGLEWEYDLTEARARPELPTGFVVGPLGKDRERDYGMAEGAGAAGDVEPARDFDTTGLTLDEVVERIVSWARERGA